MKLSGVSDRNDWYGRGTVLSAVERGVWKIFLAFRLGRRGESSSLSGQNRFASVGKGLEKGRCVIDYVIPEYLWYLVLESGPRFDSD